MVEEIVTAVTIRIASYNDMPRPEVLEQAWVYSAFVDGPVDRDQVVREIREAAQPNPHCLEDSMNRMNWGAEGSVLEILVEVAQYAGGAAGVIAAVDRLIERLQRKDTQREKVTSAMASSNARSQLAEFLKVPDEDISVHDVKKIQGEYRLKLNAGSEVFEAEVDDRNVYQLRKLHTSKPEAKAVRNLRFRSLLNRFKR